MTISQDSTHPTGVTDDTHGSGTAIVARDRKAKSALVLRRRGLTWEQIAHDLGYPTGRAALVATEVALKKELETSESAEFMRRMAGDRLDRMLRSVWKKATDPDHPEHLQAVDRVRLLIDQHARLFGYEAPKKVAVNNPSVAQLESWVAQALAMQQPPVEEANIFDIEVIDDTGDH